MNTFEIDKKYVANTYNRFPVNIVSGKGSECFDENGKRYIDLGSGIGVTACVDRGGCKAGKHPSAYIKPILHRSLCKAGADAMRKDRSKKSIFCKFGC